MPAPNSPCHGMWSVYTCSWLPERIWWCHLSAGNPLRAYYYSTYCKYCTYCTSCLWPSSSTHHSNLIHAAPSTLIFLHVLSTLGLWNDLFLSFFRSQVRSLSHRKASLDLLFKHIPSLFPCQQLVGYLGSMYFSSQFSLSFLGLNPCHLRPGLFLPSYILSSTLQPEWILKIR